jgi:HEAT repeat protein
MSDVDDLIAEAGRTHVIPPRENPALLERLRDPAVLARTRELLASKDEGVRRQAILCIERIGYILRDQETAELLLHHAVDAKNKYEAMSALDALKNCRPPEPLSSEALLRLARRRDSQVWQSALQCLHLAPADEVESALLERLEADREGLVYVARELRYMHSPESIRALEELLGDASLDVRCVALDSLGERLGAGIVPYARRLAAGRQQQEKWWAEKWLARFGGAEDVSFMADRVKSLLSGKRQRQFEPPEVSYVVDFLLRHEDIPAAQAALDAIRRRGERLPDNERKWLEAHAPQLLPSTGSPPPSADEG